MHHLGSVEAICNEKDRLIVRCAKPLAQSPSGVLSVFDKIRACKRKTGWNDTKTIEYLLDPKNLVWLVDDVGIMVLCPLIKGSAHCHIFFWDRRLRGREPLCKAVIKWVKDNTEIEVLFTVVGQEFPATVAFCSRLGFQTTRAEQGKIILVLQL